MPPSKAQAAKAFDKIYCTRLLLKYWPKLKHHCENVQYSYAEIDQIEMKVLMNFDYVDPEVFVKSLIRGKERTQIIISQVQSAIKQWEQHSGKTHAGRIRRRIIRGLYLDDNRKTVAQIAEEERLNRGLVGKYLQSSFSELSALLFGADGLLKTREAMYLHTFETKISAPKR